MKVIDEVEREAERVRVAYARRAELGVDKENKYWQPANLFILQSRERVLLDLLTKEEMLPLESRRVLDVGCGHGALLRDFQRYGARPDALHGIDLLPWPRQSMPDIDIRLGDAQALPYQDASFDLVLAFTTLSSIIDEAARQRVAREMTRVARAGGLIILYDFWVNPINSDVRPLRRKDVRRLFAAGTITFKKATMAPPIVRPLVRLPGGRLMLTALEILPFLHTHFLAALRV